MSTLTENLIHYAMTHGIIYGAKNMPTLTSSTTNTVIPVIPTLAIHAPFTLFPYNYPYKSFHKAKLLGPIFNELMNKISRNHKWLNHILQGTAESDEFTSRLLNIMNTIDNAYVNKEISYKKQDIALGKFIKLIFCYI